mmetsp:Transcript_6863/g.14098  ORF Transcript_6863/g.14098 Transcript_6863/m.14098 type:complete len:103 (+) Transcript_6863:109-417(+)
MRGVSRVATAASRAMVVSRVATAVFACSQVRGQDLALGRNEELSLVESAAEGEAVCEVDAACTPPASPPVACTPLAPPLVSGEWCVYKRSCLLTKSALLEFS